MKGETLEGLSLEELKRLEKLVEAGLRRVIQTKVFLPIFAVSEN